MTWDKVDTSADAVERLTITLHSARQTHRSVRVDPKDLDVILSALRTLAAERDAFQAELQAAVAAEREACAECCSAELRNTAQLLSNPPQSSAAWEARNAIRARGDTDDKRED